jgi:hypothetical protein
MDFELNAEFVEKNQLTEEQVTAITNEVTTHTTALEDTWKGKANEQAEGILNGAARAVETLTGVQREQGQKVADYISSASNLHFKGMHETLERKEKELEEKIKQGGGDETLKQELADVRGQLDGFKDKAAKYDEMKESDFENKYNESQKRISSMQESIAFGSIKPNFPDTVNVFEARAKWGEFINVTKEKYNIVLDEQDGNKPYAVDKENDFRKVPLEKLVKENEEIAKLLEGRQQRGTGSDTRKPVKIEGVPFEVPEKATSEERNKLIREHLAQQGIDKMSPKYGQEFAKLNQLLLGKTPVSK